MKNHPKIGKNISLQLCSNSVLKNKQKKTKRKNKVLIYKRGERDQILTQWVSTSLGKLEVQILTYEKLMNDNIHFRTWENREECKNYVRKTPQRVTTNYLSECPAFFYILSTKLKCSHKWEFFWKRNKWAYIFWCLKYVQFVFHCDSINRKSLLKRPGLWNITSEKADRFHSALKSSLAYKVR